MTSDEFNEQKASKRSKYGNVPTVVDGITFDSGVESVRWAELCLLQQDKQICALEHHPRFVLQSRFKYQGKWIRAVIYEPDFTYIELPSGQRIAEDVKGGRGTVTPLFRLKAKLFKYTHPDIELRIVER